MYTTRTNWLVLLRVEMRTWETLVNELLHCSKRLS